MNRPAGLFFGNADRVRHAVTALAAKAGPPPQVVCLTLGNSYRLSPPVLEVLGILESELRRSGAELWLTGVTSMARPQLEQDELSKTLGSGRIWPTIGSAVDRYARRSPAVGS
jgi:MFS superfamily sulfate permease-like transporter